MSKPLIITMGDPTGVGPEIIVKAVAAGAFAGMTAPVLIAGDGAVLLRAAANCSIPVRLEVGSDAPLGTHALTLDGQTLPVREMSRLNVDTLVYGRPDDCCGRAMADYIRWASDACLSGVAAGMVTAPINKLALQRAGEPFPGHTEMLASRCGVEQVVMMLAGSRLRVCLVTTHCALRQVPRLLSRQKIVSTLQITAQALRRDFDCSRPRLAVLALNPHAGEAGLFGVEEQEVIAPAIEEAVSQGLLVSGPHSADSLFWFAARGDYDAVVCMYHDQGLIPLKLLHFDDGVNVTLGLPIIRTSVDHGTAYDLAGTGQANPASLIAAVRMADAMAANQNRGKSGTL